MTVEAAGLLAVVLAPVFYASNPFRIIRTLAVEGYSLLWAAVAVLRAGSLPGRKSSHGATWWSPGAPHSSSGRGPAAAGSRRWRRESCAHRSEMALIAFGSYANLPVNL